MSQSKTMESRNLATTYTACLGSFLVSLAGGLLLGWWEYKNQPENRQLWMVPLGLILFSTPLIIWFAIFVSDICSCTEEVSVVPSPADGSNHEPDKVTKLVTSASC